MENLTIEPIGAGIIDAYEVVGAMRPGFAIPLIKTHSLGNSLYVQDVNEDGCVFGFRLYAPGEIQGFGVALDRKLITFGQAENFVVLSPTGQVLVGTQDELQSEVRSWAGKIPSLLTRLNFAEFCRDVNLIRSTLDLLFVEKAERVGAASAKRWFTSAIIVNRLYREVARSGMSVEQRRQLSDELSTGRAKITQGRITFEVSEDVLSMITAKDSKVSLERVRSYTRAIGANVLAFEAIEPKGRRSGITFLRGTPVLESDFLRSDELLPGDIESLSDFRDFLWPFRWLELWNRHKPSIVLQDLACDWVGIRFSDNNAGLVLAALLSGLSELSAAEPRQVALNWLRKAEGSARYWDSVWVKLWRDSYSRRVLSNLAFQYFKSQLLKGNRKFSGWSRIWSEHWQVNERRPELVVVAVSAMDKFGGLSSFQVQIIRRIIGDKRFESQISIVLLEWLDRTRVNGPAWAEAFVVLSRFRTIPQRLTSAGFMWLSRNRIHYKQWATVWESLAARNPHDLGIVEVGIEGLKRAVNPRVNLLPVWRGIRRLAPSHPDISTLERCGWPVDDEVGLAE